MRKIIAVILIAFFLISFGNINAQIKFKVGSHVGLSLANLSFDPDIESPLKKSSRTGFKFGGIAEISFTPMISLQIEPTYSTGGTVIEGPLFQTNLGQVVSGKVTYKLSTLDFPILFKVNIPVKGQIVPYGFVGPNIAFIMSSKELDEPTGYPSDESDAKDFISSTNFALDFGAGVGYKLNQSVTVILDLRYSLGLSSILSDKGKQAFQQNSVKTTGFNVLTGVLFAL